MQLLMLLVSFIRIKLAVGYLNATIGHSGDFIKFIKSFYKFTRFYIDFSNRQKIVETI